MPYSIYKNQLNTGSTLAPVLLLDFDAYVALTYKFESSLGAISVQDGFKQQLLAVPYSEEVVNILEIYFNPEKAFLVEPEKYAQHEKLILDSWLAEDWVYEEMLDKSLRHPQ